MPCVTEHAGYWLRQTLTSLNQPERCVIGELCHSSVVGVSCGGPVQKSGHHGHQPVRLGGGGRPRRTVCDVQLLPGSPAPSNKFPITFGSVPVPAALSSIPEGPPCPGTDRQQHDSGIYQLSGGLALPSVAHAGAQTNPVELQPSAYFQSNACSWESECRGGLAFQGHADVRGVIPASNDCGRDLSPLLAGRGGSVHVKRECAMREFLFSTQRGCSSRRRQVSA